MAQLQMAFNAPLIAKLEAWGYEEKSPAPLADIISSLDSPSLALVERLSNDLTHVNERSYDLRVKVSALTDSLKQEKLRAEKLVTDNQSLLQDKDELRRKLQELTNLTNDSKTEGNEEEQVQLWRAQSMHQLQELESMNQALRETLNLHSCCAPNDSKEVKANQPKGSAKITLTRVLAPRSNTPPPLKAKVTGCKQKSQSIVNAADVKFKLLEDELHLWKEKHSLLEDKLQSVQKELSHISEAHHTSSAKATESEALENARHPSKVDVGMNTEELEETEGGTCRAVQESNSEYCSVMDDLLSLFQVLFYFAVSVGAGLGRSTFSI
ncbi:hypothetical protein R1flu_018753 [Riccia fluitans]|uniref:Uncharacterized protein n=1 Tax=Riccia fluitans TaxID=41844 RepID=A0ABD1ZGR1_9MARC